jgi:hypothetical protein
MVAVDHLAISDSADFNPAGFWAIHHHLIICTH